MAVCCHSHARDLHDGACASAFWTRFIPLTRYICSRCSRENSADSPTRTNRRRCTSITGSDESLELALISFQCAASEMALAATGKRSTGQLAATVQSTQRQRSQDHRAKQTQHHQPSEASCDIVHAEPFSLKRRCTGPSLVCDGRARLPVRSVAVAAAVAAAARPPRAAAQVWDSPSPPSRSSSSLRQRQPC